MRDFVDGDYVTRVGDDIHLVSDVPDGFGTATFTCVYAGDDHGSFYDVGDVESNLVSRYALIEEGDALYKIAEGIKNES